MGVLSDKLTELGLSIEGGESDAPVLCRAKALCHCDIAIPDPWTCDDVTIAVTSVSCTDRVLRVELDASGCSEHVFLFVNPPLQVTAGVDDVAGAFAAMVQDAVLRAAG